MPEVPSHPRTTRPTTGRTGDVDFEERLPDDARVALEELRTTHGTRIAKALATDPELADRFTTNPVRALESIGVPVPAALARFAKTDPRVAPLRQRRGVRLPDGRVVAANVRIRFTSGGDR